MGTLIQIVGAPFTGKTVSACTFPKPLDYFELDVGGFESVKHARGADGRLIVPDWELIRRIKLNYKEAYDLSFLTAEKKDFASGGSPAHTKRSIGLMKEFNAELKALFDSSKPAPKTVVIDSGTTMFRIWKDAILHTNNIPALRIADYGTLEGVLFRQFLPTLQALVAERVAWVILINHENVDKDELTGQIVESPVGPSANMGRALPKEFDEVWRQRVESNQYVWRTRKSGLFIGAGSRLSLPDPISPATFQELEKHLKEVK
jgi:hypothetical protein